MQKLSVHPLATLPAAFFDDDQTVLKLLQFPGDRCLALAYAQFGGDLPEGRYLLGDEFSMMVDGCVMAELELALLLLELLATHIQMLLKLNQLLLLGTEHLLDVTQVELLILELDGVGGWIIGDRLLREELAVPKGDVLSAAGGMVELEGSHGVLELVEGVLAPKHASFEDFHLNYIRYRAPLQQLQLMKALFIIGPSGSGKSTLAAKLAELHSEMFGKDSAVLVNLDCANEGGEIDICSIVRLDDIMEEYEIGPNASLLYAAELLEQNVQWLYEEIEQAVAKRNPSASIRRNTKAVEKLKLEELQTDNLLLIFDLPGQTELFLNHDSLKNIIYLLIERFRLEPCFLELFDATYIYNLSDFTSMVMMSLATICHIEIPHIGILNKIDLCKGRRPCDGTLTDYFGLPSLKQLLADHLDLGEEQCVLKAIAGIVDEYSQVSFSPCSIYKPDLLLSLFVQLQKIFGTLQNNLLSCRRFATEVKDLLSDLGGEGVRINLECELFGEEEEMDYEQELKKIRSER